MDAHGHAHEGIIMGVLPKRAGTRRKRPTSARTQGGYIIYPHAHGAIVGAFLGV